MFPQSIFTSKAQGVAQLLRILDNILKIHTIAAENRLCPTFMSAGSAAPRSKELHCDDEVLEDDSG